MSDAIEALSVALGPGIVLSYLWAGLFHPARKVRERYWVVYNHVYLRHQGAMVSLFRLSLNLAHLLRAGALLPQIIGRPSVGGTICVGCLCVA
jgi:hypothetical protein